MSTNVPADPVSAFSRLRDAEKRAILDELTAGESRVLGLAEAAAQRRLACVDEDAIAGAIADIVGGVPHDEMAAHVGRTRYGYVEPTEAAWELLQREIEPWIEDLRRRAAVGLSDAVRRLAVGVVDGLHRLEPLTTDDARLLSWAPDFPGEAAQDVLRTLDALAIDRPLGDLERVAPDWA